MMVATRSDGVTVTTMLEHTPPVHSDRQNRLAGYIECRDPECPKWAEYVAKFDSFYVHYHALP